MGAYSVRRGGDAIVLRDEHHDASVSIAPSTGNLAFEMTVQGANVLHWPYASLAAFKARPEMCGIPFLGPWANRLDGQAFHANGKRYELDMTLGNVRGPYAIHGFLTTTDKWELLDADADAVSAWTASRLDFSREPAWMRQFPFAHVIEMTHRLQDGALAIELSIRNTGRERMPVSVGFHPYFVLPDSPRDEWAISLPARTRWLLAETKLPTGEREPIERLFPDPRSIALKNYDLDDLFSDLVRDSAGRAHFFVKGARRQLEVTFGPNWRGAVVWSPPGAGFICIEPMAGITNGMNLAHSGLYKEQQHVEPGEAWRESFWVKLLSLEP